MLYPAVINALPAFESIANAYLNNGFNELKAYENSKYSQNCTVVCKRANTTKILKKRHVALYINEKMAEISKKEDITTELIAKEIADIAFGRITFTVGFQANMANKLKALELLGRWRAMFTDNVATTDTIRQRELDEKDKAEAIQIAEIRLREVG